VDKSTLAFQGTAQPPLTAFLLKSRWFCVDVHACVRTQTGCAIAGMIGLGWPGAEAYTRDRLTTSAMSAESPLSDYTIDLVMKTRAQPIRGWSHSPLTCSLLRSTRLHGAAAIFLAFGRDGSLLSSRESTVDNVLMW
jgi:hypothetical protein